MLSQGGSPSDISRLWASVCVLGRPSSLVLTDAGRIAKRVARNDSRRPTRTPMRFRLADLHVYVSVRTPGFFFSH